MVVLKHKGEESYRNRNRAYQQLMTKGFHRFIASFVIVGSLLLLVSFMLRESTQSEYHGDLDLWLSFGIGFIVTALIKYFELRRYKATQAELMEGKVKRAKELGGLEATIVLTEDYIEASDFDFTFRSTWLGIQSLKEYKGCIFLINSSQAPAQISIEKAMLNEKELKELYDLFKRKGLQS
jgi:hypothetical protein